MLVLWSACMQSPAGRRSSYSQQAHSSYVVSYRRLAQAVAILLLLLSCLLLRELRRNLLLPALPATASPPLRTAVVVPFVWCQLQLRVAQNFAAWRATPPCNPDDLTQRATLGALSLVFYFNRDLDSVLELDGRSGKPALTSLWESLGPLQRCFPGGVHYISANLTDEQNVYPTGTCVQFYDAFAVLRRLRFDHWFQMEPDVFALRPGWGVRLAELASQNARCQNFWQAGSLPMYPNSHDFLARIDNGTSLDQHLNGNSLYCLSDARFDDYLSRVQRASPHGCGSRTEAGWPLFGFDYAMYRFRAHPAHQEYMRTVKHKFIATGFIVNIARQQLNASELLALHPEMFLVHTQTHYNDSKEMAVCRRKERAVRQSGELQSYAAAVPVGMQRQRAEHAPDGCTQLVFDEQFQRSVGQQSHEVTGAAHILQPESSTPVLQLTSAFPGDIGHVEFNAVYSHDALCSAFRCALSAYFTVSVSKPTEQTQVADGMAFSFVDATKHTSGATPYVSMSGVLVPADALSLVVDEYDNGDGDGYLLVSSFAGRAVVLARKAGLHPAIRSGETVALRMTLTASRTVQVEVGGQLVFENEYAHVPASFFLLVTANSGDFSSSHLLHGVQLCTSTGES